MSSIKDLGETGTGKKSPSGYQFGEFQIYLAEEMLCRAGEKLNINRRMFQVLLLLVERAGEIVTKEQFFEKVWADSFVEDNNLTVAITSLRKILGDDAKRPEFIENLPRKGYRFIAEVAALERPQKIKKPAEGHGFTALAATSHPSIWSSRKVLIGVVGTCLLFLIFSIGFSYLRSAHSTRQLNSIAVLPFENENAETEYLSDGLAESVIDSLNTLPDLRVVSRNSAFQYKNKPVDAMTIGRTLNVSGMLTGHFVQHGDELIISVEFTDIQSNKQIWTKQFNRNVNDLLGLQQDISRDIGQTLRPELTIEQQQRSTKRETDSVEAYQLYLRGTYFFNRRNESDFRKATAFFRQAIAIDPTYAQAFAGLANCYSMGSFDYIRTREDRTSLTLGATQKALEIDPTLGEAHATQGLTKQFFEWDWDGAEEEYKIAIANKPNYATAHHWYAELLAIEGRYDESLVEYERALELDPLSMAIRTDIGTTYHFAGQYDQAVLSLKRSIEIDPSYLRSHFYLAEVYRTMGMFDESIDELERARRINDALYADDAAGLEILNSRIGALRKALARSGQRGYWETMLKFRREDGSQYGIKDAFFYARLGNADKAFECLEAAYTARDASLIYLKGRHELDGIRSDPRFNDVIHRLGLTR